MRKLHPVLFSLFLLPSLALADAAFPAFTCPKDSNGDRLTVTLASSPGPLGGLFYDIAPAPGERPMRGKLARSWRGGTYPARLLGRDLWISVPAVDSGLLPRGKVGISYRIHRERQVNVVCQKGPSFSSLFKR